MAIVKVTRLNFTNYIKSNLDKVGGFEGMMAAAFLGGKEKLKLALEDFPEEQEIYINTDYIMAVTSCILLTDINKLIFQITLANPVKDGQQTINIKGEEFEDFIQAFITATKYK